MTGALIYYSYSTDATTTTSNTTTGKLSAPASNPLTAKFTWKPAYPGEPAPANVILVQDCKTGWDGAASGNATCQGVLDDGLGQTATSAAGATSGSCNGTKYTVKSPAADGSVTVTCSPSASFTGTSGTNGSVGESGPSINYSANVYPLTINLSGPTLVGGSPHILVGQQCQASLIGIPSGCTASNLQWSVSGWTVQGNSWMVSADHTKATFSGPNAAYTYTQATLSSPSPSWYWDDLAGAETVTCTATVTPPVGQGAAFPFTVNQKVALDVPSYTSIEPVGVVVLNYHYYLDDGRNGQPLALVLAAGGGDSAAPSAEQDNGITFQDTVLTPALYSGTGSWYHLQQISVSRYETPTGNNTAVGAQGNAVTAALDPGPGSALAIAQTFPADGTDADPDNDSPALGVSDPFQEFNVKNEKFQDYIMYTPPTPPGGNSIPVPLAYYTWQWNVDVSKPPTPLPKSWANWNDRATTGTVAGPNANSASRQLIYPIWSSLRNLAWSTH